MRQDTVRRSYGGRRHPHGRTAGRPRRCRRRRLALRPCRRPPRPPTAAPSAAGRPPSGSAAAASARPGARWPRRPRRRCARRRRPGDQRPRCRSARSRSRTRTFRTSGVPELDRVLGGGLVPGAAILLAGEPGVGKSTLLLEVAAQTARVPAPHPLRHRRGVRLPGPAARRPHRRRPRRALPRRRDRPRRGAHPHRGRCARRCWSSTPIQTIGASGVDGVPGGVTQVKEVAAALIRVAKTRNITTVLVGHVTKDGSIAGPRVLEHLVDVVLHFEGDRNSRFRMVRAMKNRFGPVDEVGCFDLVRRGHHRGHRPDRPVRRAPRRSQVPGTCVAVTMEGRRPLLAEVQALVTRIAARAAAAYDVGARLARGSRWCSPCSSSTAGIRLHTHDVFASTVGGARLHEPASDLAVAVALASADHGGRRARRAWWRWARSAWPASCAGSATCRSGIAEAARLGFRVAVVPAERRERRAPPRARTVDGMRVLDVPDVASRAARCSTRPSDGAGPRAAADRREPADPLD